MSQQNGGEARPSGRLFEVDKSLGVAGRTIEFEFRRHDRAVCIGTGADRLPLAPSAACRFVLPL